MSGYVWLDALGRLIFESVFHVFGVCGLEGLLLVVWVVQVYDIALLWQHCHHERALHVILAVDIVDDYRVATQHDAIVELCL